MGFGDVVDDEHSARSFVVHLAQRFVALLAGSVPEGDFDFLVAHLHYFGEELNPHRRFLTLVELITDVACADVGLARPCRPNHHYFKHFVVVVGVHFPGIINLLGLAHYKRDWTL